ncbi:MAG: hypothetical protein ACK4V6_11050 [Microthrixaceae bacterium]
MSITSPEFDVEAFAPKELSDRAADLAAALEQVTTTLRPLSDLAEELLRELNMRSHSDAALALPADVQDSLALMSGERRLCDALWDLKEMSDYEAMHSSWRRQESLD